MYDCCHEVPATWIPMQGKGKRKYEWKKKCCISFSSLCNFLFCYDSLTAFRKGKCTVKWKLQGKKIQLKFLLCLIKVKIFPFLPHRPWALEEEDMSLQNKFPLIHTYFFLVLLLSMLYFRNLVVNYPIDVSPHKEHILQISSYPYQVKNEANSFWCKIVFTLLKCHWLLFLIYGGEWQNSIMIFFYHDAFP